MKFVNVFPLEVFITGYNGVELASLKATKHFSRGWFYFRVAQHASRCPYLLNASMPVLLNLIVGLNPILANGAVFRRAVSGLFLRAYSLV